MLSYLVHFTQKVIANRDNNIHMDIFYTTLSFLLVSYEAFEHMPWYYFLGFRILAREIY